MNESPYLALIHASIDGELDEHQRATLAGHLLVDPQSRALRDNLKYLCAALDGIAAVEAPEHLKASILAALPPMAAKPRQAKRAAYWGAPAWRYAAVFAGALIIGALWFDAGGRRGPDPSEIAGTMAASGARPGVIVDTARVDLGQAQGQVSLYRAAAGLGLELNLVAREPVDVLVTSGAQTLRIRGVGGPDSAGSRRVVLPGVALRGQRLDLTFLVAGRQIGAAMLSVPAGR
jgi:anti-sigma factor RsiW